MPEPTRSIFETCIQPHLDALFRAAYRLTGNQADAEELVQETCLRAFSREPELADVTSPLGWLMRVQYNLFIDGSRRRERSPVPGFDELEHAGSELDYCDPQSEVELADRLDEITDAWLLLNADQRALLTLRVEGYSLAEMSEITQLGIPAINARLRRARQSLIRHLDRNSSPASPNRCKEVGK